MRKKGVVAFSFGVPDTICSNQRIAQIASQKAWELIAPVYTQRDVRVEQDIEVEYTEEEFGNPPPTLRMARGAVRWAKRYGLTELWVVAAKPHLWRALRDVQQAVREAGARIEVQVCKEVEQYPEDSWFCPDSRQERTTSRKAWNKRDRVLKWMPFVLYELIAS